MRLINIFFKISNSRQFWFTRFVRFAIIKLCCKSANQKKTISGSQLLQNTRIIKQTVVLLWINWRKYGAVSYLFSCRKTFCGIPPFHKQAVINVSSCSISGLSAIKNHSSLFIDRGILNILTSCVGCKVTWG